jgi:hypothetical protein
VNSFPLCKDCRHFGGLDGDSARCLNPRNAFFDPVRGGKKPYDCTWLRNLTDKGKCGIAGTWWEAK